MSKLKLLAMTASLGVMAVVLFLAGCGPTDSSEPTSTARQPGQPATAQHLAGEMGLHERSGGDCTACHAKAVQSVKAATSPHAKVDCASCHQAVAQGYAMNLWAPGSAQGNPVTAPTDRNVSYFKEMWAPVLLKTPSDGIWRPYNVEPHISTNIKKEQLKVSTKLLQRQEPDVPIKRLKQDQSTDLFAILGSVPGTTERSGSGENAKQVPEGDVMVWYHIDRIAPHTVVKGKARDCQSCHASPQQSVSIDWGWWSTDRTKADDKPTSQYKDVIDGKYTIVADEKGLRVTNWEVTQGPGNGNAPSKGLEPYIPLWEKGVPGSYAIPSDPAKVAEHQAQYKPGEPYHK